MILIVSDLHLGKGSPAADKANKYPRSLSDDQSLGDLMECIQSVGPDLKEVIFLGDTFDAFIEYKRIIPDSVVKWTRAAAEIQQMNIRVSFFAGNHDRWHGNHIQKSLNIDVRRDPQIVSVKDKLVWMEHGDEAAPNSSLVQFIRYMSDLRWVLFLYRLVLPFGLGQHLAAYVSRTFSNFELNPKTILGLKTYAVGLLTAKRADLVVLGHCHDAMLENVRTGSPENALYANTGDWYESRTFLLISDSVQLCRWTSKGLTVLKQEIF